MERGCIMTYHDHHDKSVFHLSLPKTVGVIFA